MSKSKSRRRRRKNRAMFVTILTFVLLGALLILILVVLSQAGGKKTDTPAMSTLDNPVAILSASDSPVSTFTEGQTPVPTETPAPSPTPVPTAEPTPSPTPVAEAFEYLPVVSHGPDNRKRIAITVDDCYQIENLKTIISCAYQNGAKLTLFPIGENIVRDGMADVLKACVFQLGFEIENHTYSHSRIFRMSEEDMAAQIWGQDYALNQALGVNYQEHFFRLMGGDGENDQRTHNYLKQLGYQAIASWSYSGSDADINHIKARLKPGAIFLFHTTDADLPKILEFIPYAISEGYELVTLNQLMGLPDNEISDLSTAATEMPMPQPYAPDYSEVKKGDYTWSTVLIQRRLAELGYLNGSSKTATKGDPADGVYGEGTAKAVAQYQSDHGLNPTGVADAETQKMLLGAT